MDDAQRAAQLVSSAKDLEEHRFAVNSVIESLRGHLLAMHVPEAPYVLALPNVLHLATDIYGIWTRLARGNFGEHRHPSARSMFLVYDKSPAVT